jgi:Carboxypeptidase regulatory-like domain
MSTSLLMIFAGAAGAQLANQTALVGTVTDASAAVIPGATVVAVNVGTQDRYETTTNAQGYYNIQFIMIGRYEVTVTLSGFQTFRATGIEVGTNQIVRQDAILQVGGMADGDGGGGCHAARDRERHHRGDDQRVDGRGAAAQRWP